MATKEISIAVMDKEEMLNQWEEKENDIFSLDLEYAQFEFNIEGRTDVYEIDFETDEEIDGEYESVVVGNFRLIGEEIDLKWYQKQFIAEKDFDKLIKNLEEVCHKDLVAVIMASEIFQIRTFVEGGILNEEGIDEFDELFSDYKGEFRAALLLRLDSCIDDYVSCVQICLNKEQTLQFIEYLKSQQEKVETIKITY